MGHKKSRSCSPPDPCRCSCMGSSGSDHHPTTCQFFITAWDADKICGEVPSASGNGGQCDSGLCYELHPGNHWLQRSLGFSCFYLLIAWWHMISWLVQGVSQTYKFHTSESHYKEAKLEGQQWKHHKIKVVYKQTHLSQVGFYSSNHPEFSDASQEATNDHSSGWWMRAHGSRYVSTVILLDLNLTK